MTTAQERAILAQAAKIKLKKNRAIRQKITAARKPGGKADRGRERDNGFRQYIRRQPCEARHLGGCDGPVQHAHVSYRVHGIANSFGRGVKNHDRHGNPLCAAHHEMQHHLTERPFWERLGKDPYTTSAAHYAAFSEQTA